MLPTDPPRRTGKAPVDLTLTGKLIPWNAEDQPCYLAMGSGDPDRPIFAIPVFECSADLARAVSTLALEYDHVKVVSDHHEFLQSVPPDILVVMSPQLSERGSLVYTLVLRD